MKRSSIATLALGAAFAASSLGVTQTPAKADTGSTVAIAAGAAAIVGALLIDSNTHRQYYVRNNRRYYVSDNVASYYRSHRGNHAYVAHNNHNNNMRGRDNRGQDDHRH